MKKEDVFALIGIVIALVSAVFAYPPWREYKSKQEQSLPTAIINTPQIKSTSVFATSVPTLFETPFVDQGFGFFDNWHQDGRADIVLLDNGVKVLPNQIVTFYSKNRSLHNITIEGDILYLSSINDNANYGIQIRRQDNCRLYYVKFVPKTSTLMDIEIIKKQDCSEDGNIVLNRCDYPVDTLKPHHITVSVTGNDKATITVSVNGETLLTAYENNEFFFFGNVGIHTESAEIEFANFTVY